ncbi:hypothetical protein [Pseudomonas sp. S11P7]|uniref:hypothetical protein n=1 Tax=Pseudomonas sp. S11P7 TaxID=3029169 RepID=UPI00215D4CCF|nr:hypothetical protein [Pseudomonas sp. S11P7]MCR8976998.1 hypothetical protein [Pseudomonas sp. S11P7]
MSEVSIYVRQAGQPQIAQIELQADGSTVMGMSLRPLSAPATDDSVVGRDPISSVLCIERQLVGANVPAQIASTGKNPGVELAFESRELLLKTAHLDGRGVNVHGPKVFSALLQVFWGNSRR